MEFEIAQKRFVFLQQEIEKYNIHYYVLNQPLVDDATFDLLFNELLSIEKQYPSLKTKHSPSQKIGSDLLHDFQEVPHTIPMLSLDKLYDIPLLKKWIEKYSSLESLFSLEPKIDGFSVALYYQNGALWQALSRGNGEIGNDITSNIKTITSIPLTINSKNSYILRGEVFITKEDFSQINEENQETPYANPRNFAAGVIRRINSQEVAEVPLKILIYEATCLEKPFLNHEQMLQFLIEEHFPVSQLNCFLDSQTSETLFLKNPIDINYVALYQTSSNLQKYALSELTTIIQSIESHRPLIPYEMDGVVLKINNYPLRNRLGSTSHHPKWAIAFKFQTQGASSIVEKIIVQVGRTGKITPLALIHPVTIDGSMVSKATLHNQDYIHSLNLNQGDVVKVSKRGGIIPSVDLVLEKKTEGVYLIPSHCPSCDTLLEEKGAHLFCVHLKCEAKKIGQLLYFCQVIDLEGFGQSFIQFLVEKYSIFDFIDLFTFDYQKLLHHEGFQAKKIQNYELAIQKSIDKTSFTTLLKALGIPEISDKNIQLLMNHGYSSLKTLKTFSQKDNLESLQSWYGLGKNGAQRLLEAFSPESTYLKILTDLVDQIGFRGQEEISTSTIQPLNFSLSGTIWLITGTLTHFHPRQLAEEEIIKRGGVVKSSFNKEISHLLVGDSPGSKLEKAKKNNILVITENDFLKMIS